MNTEQKQSNIIELSEASGGYKIVEREDLEEDPGHMEKTNVTESKDDKKGQQLQSQASVLTGSGNIEKIRDILFGSQIREYEKRFVRLEDRMQKELSALKDDLRKSFESLESFIKREIELLNERHQKEQNERYMAVKGLSDELKEVSLEFDRKITDNEAQINKKARDLHEQLLAQSKNLSEEINQKYQAISASLEKEAHELREDKVDRATLSELLMEMALRINKTPVDFDVAANELLDE